MDDLRRLDGQTHTQGGLLANVPEARLINTPLRSEMWARALQRHPDREFVAYLLRGMRSGFRIGFTQTTVRSARRNMLSAEQNPEVVDKYLAREREAGRVIGPLPANLTGVHVSRFGVIPKPHQPGRWRLIVDLSHPKGTGMSVNDGIDPALCSLAYTSTDDAARRILDLGKGAMLAKLDIASAYRIVPVHPDDRPLLGMAWRQQRFVDTALPFGLRSAPKIFTAVADGLMWIMYEEGVTSTLHYLDDFLFLGSPKGGECESSLRRAVEVCQRLGVPLATEKVEGPNRGLTFLGIFLDTMKMELRLPEDKLHRLSQLIKTWQGRRSCKKRKLLSLIGHLQDACRVVRPGRSFLRRMITLSTVARKLHHRIRLNRGFRSDLEWWAMFLRDWNGVSMMTSVARTPPQRTLTSDASGNWGCGAFSCTGGWFQCQWPSSWAGIHITVKELVPIVLACALWAHQWKGKTVLCRCDNAAVVAIINSGRSKHDLVMHLMRSLFFFTARGNVTLQAVHLPGRHNQAADAISRDNVSLFFRQVPWASHRPTPIPSELVAVLLHHQPDWTSPVWRSQFAIISSRV